MPQAIFSIDFALTVPHSAAHLSHTSEVTELRYSLGCFLGRRMPDQHSSGMSFRAAAIISSNVFECSGDFASNAGLSAAIGLDKLSSNIAANAST
jgi:hypothetical protein